MNNALSIYRESKSFLATIANEAKKQHGDDYPMRREIINNQADQIRKQLEFHKMREQISEKQYAQFCIWIDAAACKLHPRTK